MIKSNEKSDQWSAMLKKLFPTGIPERVTWTNPDEISRVLELLSTEAPNNILYYPNGGWDTIRNANISSQDGCIELKCAFTEILKPSGLTFCNHPDSDWSFFYLECLDSSTEDVAFPKIGTLQLLAELPDGNIVPRTGNNENALTGEILPFDAKLIRTFAKGNWVIFNKYSAYGQNVYNTDGSHSNKDVNAFANYINFISLAVQES